MTIVEVQTEDSPATRTRRGPGLLLLPGVAAVIAAGASPSIAHALPRFFFPAVALVGGVMATVGLVRAGVRLARGERRPADLVRFGVILVAFVLLALLPFVRLLGVLAAPSTGPPYILAGFGDWIGGRAIRIRDGIAASTSRAGWAATCWRRPTAAS